MTPEIEALKKIAAQRITKGKLPALQKVYDNTYSLYERLQPKSDDEDTTTDFESAEQDLRSALDDLDSAISDLDSAEEKDERDDAISMIEDALDQLITAFDAIMPSATVGTTPRPQPAAPKLTDLDPELLQKVREVLASPQHNLNEALDAWVQSAGPPDLVKKRKRKIAQFFECIASVKPPPTPPAS